MAYSLTLTSGERKAIDFVGHRYSCGDQFYEILFDCIPPDAEWDDDNDITFDIPEHKAWGINDIRESDMEGGHSPWPMFSNDFAYKMEDFCCQIV